MAYSARLALYLDDSVRASLDKRAYFASGLVPSGTIRSTASGDAILNGCWKNVSGSPYADYMILKSKNDSKELVYSLVDKNLVDIKNEWNMIGLQETASETVVVNNVKLPASNSFSSKLSDDGIRSNEYFSKAVRPPFSAIGGITTFAPLVGGALQLENHLYEDLKNPHSEELLKTIKESIKVVKRVANILDEWKYDSNAEAVRTLVSQQANNLRTDANIYIMNGGTNIWRADNNIGNILRDIIIGSSHPAMRIQK